jgi:hypothetical protein
MTITRLWNILAGALLCGLAAFAVLLAALLGSLL